MALWYAEGMEHPAKIFGRWLKAKRQEARLVARVFAGRIGLYPSEYAEVEAGVVSWFSREQEAAAIEALSLSQDESEEFLALLAAARAADALQFEQVFTREQLTPARTRSNGGQLTESTQAAILDAVFSPLK